MSSILQSNGTMDTRSKLTFVLLGHPPLLDNMLVCPFIYLACFICPNLTLFVSMFFACSPYLSFFLSLLVCWSVSFVFACTCMEHEHLEQGYDLLGTSKKSKDASKRIQAHQGAMFNRLGSVAPLEWFSPSLSLFKPLL